jgi:hypothetical protein
MKKGLRPRWGGESVHKLNFTPRQGFPQRGGNAGMGFEGAGKRTLGYNSSMSTLVYPTADFPVVLRPARFSTEEYLAMVDAGFLEGKRVELIDGVIVAMSPAGPQHNQFLGRLNQLLAPIWDKGEVWIQGTLSVVDAQVFDPDVMLLRKKENGYKQQLP